MDDEELEDFINRQKLSSWGNVEERMVNGRTLIRISPPKRINIEDWLIRKIDADRARERRWDKKKKR